MPGHPKKPRKYANSPKPELSIEERARGGGDDAHKFLIANCKAWLKMDTTTRQKEMSELNAITDRQLLIHFTNVAGQTGLRDTFSVKTWDSLQNTLKNYYSIEKEKGYPINGFLSPAEKGKVIRWIMTLRDHHARATLSEYGEEHTQKIFK